ncbi:hypothetical protein PT974_03088 [Cladobotryum mycophilum]|uniref:Uncharacterized protein n=1 Tax=Cladobotryum mycophilum TaxID=491253 RepID=A0ABR0SW17_9HYPO
MHFTTIISTAAAAAAFVNGANAAALNKRQNGVHAIDFTGFTEKGCNKGSQGVQTIYSADIRNNKCMSLNSNGIKSLNMSFLNEIGGCYFTVYPNNDCSSGGQNLALGQCIDATETWEAYSIWCALTQD